MLLVILLVLLVLALGGGGWGYKRWGYSGFSPALLVVLIVGVLWFAGYIRQGIRPKWIAVPYHPDRGKSN